MNTHTHKAHTKHKNTYKARTHKAHKAHTNKAHKQSTQSTNVKHTKHTKHTEHTRTHAAMTGGALNFIHPSTVTMVCWAFDASKALLPVSDDGMGRKRGDAEHVSTNLSLRSVPNTGTHNEQQTV